jgi:hypothetical protein
VTGVWIAVIVAIFAVVGVLLVRRTMQGAIVESLPLDPGEQVLLEEEGLKVYHRFRRTSVRGGGETTFRVRSRVTDRRIVLATGGPEGTHKFVLLLVLDRTSTPPPPAGETGYGAYRDRFRLTNGYPTYPVSAADARVEEDGGDAVLHVEVPFPGGDPPEVKITTPNAARYLAALGGG